MPTITRPPPALVVLGVLAAVIAASALYEAALAIGLTAYRPGASVPPGAGSSRPGSWRSGWRHW